jgi:hypothetical protein
VEAAEKLEAVTIDSGKVESVVETKAAPEETNLVAENTDAQVAESNPATVESGAKAKPAAKTYDSLEAVLKGMTDHEEQLKAMKSQIQEMLSNSAVLRKSIKQLVTDAQKGNAAEVELAQARRKLSTLKNFLATV